MAAFAAAPRGTQSRVADALGVRATAVNKWAKGYNVPEPQHWQQLEQLLDLPAGELTGEIGATRLDAARRFERLVQAHLRLVERVELLCERLGVDASGLRFDPSNDDPIAR